MLKILVFIGLVLIACPAFCQLSSHCTLLGSTEGSCRAVADYGGFKLIGAGTNVVVLDCSDPAHPVRVGSLNISEKARSIAVSGNIACAMTGAAGLYVSNAAKPQELGHLNTPGIATGLDVRADTVYVADSVAGLRIIDVSAPANPQQIGFYNTSGTAMAVEVKGNIVYVADTGNGLMVIRYGTPNTSPTASFTVDPSSGTTETVFNFDAAGCSDRQDPISALQIRWDWENDKIWDTDYSTTKTAIHQYLTIGTKTINMEVQDTGGFIDHCTRHITVKAGGETGTVTDIDGNTYKTVKIGDQWWMTENLKVTHYRNGDAIATITDDAEWSNLSSSGACCNYENDTIHVATYGRIYNWDAVNDSRSIAPAGWHVPGDEEWKQLEMHLGMSRSWADETGPRGYDEGGKMKTTGTIEAGTGLWRSPNWGATDESRFSALPGGYRASDGRFAGMSYSAFFWTATVFDNALAWSRGLYYMATGVNRSWSMRREGGSVRCVKDHGSYCDTCKREIPRAFELNQNYPNPFNSATVISYCLPSTCHVKLALYNIRGEEVATLLNGQKSAGFYSITWAADKLSNGLYFCQLQADDICLVKKLIIQK